MRNFSCQKNSIRFRKIKKVVFRNTRKIEEVKTPDNSTVEIYLNDVGYRYIYDLAGETQPPLLGSFHYHKTVSRRLFPLV